MAQHTLWSEHHERFAPEAAGLPAQQVEILGSCRRLADVHVAFGGELHEAFDTSAGVFRPLTFVTVRKLKNEPGGQSPFIFAGADELIDDYLRAVDEVAELR